MTISKELLLAILSMDSYNQGYGKGLETGTTHIGNASLLGPADGVPAGMLFQWLSSGFYAAAYDTPYGQVISYRGTSTDSTLSTLLDAATGWPVSAGVNIATQAQQAISFYNAASGYKVSDGTQSGVIITGHSLGGALAGYLSALTGDQAIGYDHAPFGLAAAIEHISHLSTTKLTFSNFSGITVTPHLII